MHATARRRLIDAAAVARRLRSANERGATGAALCREMENLAPARIEWRYPPGFWRARLWGFTATHPTAGGAVIAWTETVERALREALAETPLPRAQDHAPDARAARLAAARAVLADIRHHDDDTLRVACATMLLHSPRYIDRDRAERLAAILNQSPAAPLTEPADTAPAGQRAGRGSGEAP